MNCWRQNPTEELTESFRECHDAVAKVCTAFQERLQKVVEDFPPGREMDPNDIAGTALEKGEAYFRKEREELRDVLDDLQRTGGVEAYGAEVFAKLERLDTLSKCLVASLQELRWTIMINDGLLAPSIGGTCANGAGFMESMENL